MAICLQREMLCGRNTINNDGKHARNDKDSFDVTRQRVLIKAAFRFVLAYQPFTKSLVWIRHRSKYEV